MRFDFRTAVEESAEELAEFTTAELKDNGLLDGKTDG